MKGLKIKKGLSLETFIKKVYEPQKEYIRQKIADSENLRLRRYWEQKEKRLERSYRFRQTRERIPEAFNIRVDVDQYKPKIQKIGLTKTASGAPVISGGTFKGSIDINKILQENKQLRKEKSERDRKIKMLEKEIARMKSRRDYKARTGRDPTEAKSVRELGKMSESKKERINSYEELMDKMEREQVHTKMSLAQRIRLVGNNMFMSKLKDRLSSKQYSVSEIKKMLDPFREAVGKKAYIMEEPKIASRFKKYEKEIMKEQRKLKKEDKIKK